MENRRVVAQGCRKTRKLICGMEGKKVVAYGRAPSPAHLTFNCHGHWPSQLFTNWFYFIWTLVNLNKMLALIKFSNYFREPSQRFSWISSSNFLQKFYVICKIKIVQSLLNNFLNKLKSSINAVIRKLKFTCLDIRQKVSLKNILLLKTWTKKLKIKN